MKIGIVTFHAVHNFGAVLQAYGLQEYLCSIGHDAYIIDYYPEYLKERYKAFSLKRVLSNSGMDCIKFFIREFMAYPILKRRECFFRDFLSSFLRRESLDSLDKQNGYDAFVFGSDQVWNPLICNGFDPMFFGEFLAAEGKRLVSYAGSMGSLKNFSEEQKDIFLKKIAPFYAISSREKEPAEFIAKGLNRPVVTVVDPVLLAGREVFDKIATAITLPKPYLLLFTLGNDEKYIVTEFGSNIGLTEYAKHNMSECCIDFKIVYEKLNYSYTFGELNKEELAIIENYVLNHQQKMELKERLNEVTYVKQKLDRIKTVSPLGEAVVYHMKRCNITSEQLMERSGLGSTTITKLRTGKGRPKLETILAFCVALNLEEYFRTDLMNKAGVRFDNNNPAHLVYITILELMPDANVFQINEFLKEEGFTPWTQDRQGTIAAAI